MLVDWVALSLVPGLGPVGCRRLLDHFHTPRAVLSASPAELSRVAGVQARQLNNLSTVDEWRRQGERQLQALAAAGACALPLDDPAYPDRLRQLPDPPVVLYLRGNPALLSAPGIAVVGSRAATSYGRRIAFSLAGGVAGAGLTVTSGLALGIDSEAHAGALAVAGNTVAVLGCGLDIFYPPANRQLAQKIAEQGALVSEYPLGTTPESFRFPARNRIIAGLAQGVLVVEATKRSGSLITAQIALDLNREVFAVPGQVDSGKSEGCHWLLQQGAKLVQRVDDILVEIGPASGQRERPAPAPVSLPAGFDPAATALFELLEPYPQTRDELLARSGLAPARLSELLLILELEGVAALLPGDRVERTGR